MTAAPDYLEPVEGWRLWKVVERDRRSFLGSLFYGGTWSYLVPFPAACEHRRFSLRTPWRRRPSGHPAPEESCTCGIHAAFEPSDVLPYLDRFAGHRPYCALGRVALWGDVVECQRGYRAQYAYPTRLYVLDFGSRSRSRFDLLPETVVEELDSYEVPVEVLAVADDDDLPEWLTGSGIRPDTVVP
jgi:hypothetical protein